MVRFAAIAFLLAHGVAWAQGEHPWVGVAFKAEAESYFTNIKSGDIVESPVVLKFGMRNYGIAPAGHKVNIRGTGHHHLLIDTPLPSSITNPIPFSDKYMHFGRGQMEAILNLPPGHHTVRLLMADYEHVPYFVFSPEISFTVSRYNPAALPADYGKQARLELLNLANGANLYSPFLLQFHASALNVSHADTKMPNTGYFQVRFRRLDGPRDTPVDIPFPDGRTESWFNLPVGTYRVQLQFVRNPDRVVEDVTSDPVTINVNSRATRSPSTSAPVGDAAKQSAVAGQF